jgi:hypothetical protein
MDQMNQEAGALKKENQKLKSSVKALKGFSLVFQEQNSRV